MAAPFVIVMVVMCVALMKDLRHDSLTRRGKRCTVAIEQAVEYGTQNYGDRFYLPVKPGPADASGDGATAPEASVTPQDEEQRREHVEPPSRDRSEEATRT